MIQSSFAPTPYTIRKTESIDTLVKEIPKLPINNLTELRLGKQMIFNSVYYSMFLSGIEVYIGDAERLLFQNDVGKIDTEKAQFFLNYKKIINYIHSYYTKSSAIINKQFVCNINTTLFDNTRFSIIKNDYRKTNFEVNVRYTPCSYERIPDEMEKLYSYLYEDGEINPIIKSIIFYVNFLRIMPFESGNGRTARAITLLYLYRNGYSLEGFLSIEKYLSINRGKKYNFLISKALGQNYEGEGNMGAFIDFYLLSFSKSVKKIHEYILNPDLIDNDEYGYLNERQKKLLHYLKDNKMISLSEYLINISSITTQANYDFDKLRDLGFIQKKGFGRSTYYILRKDI